MTINGLFFILAKGEEFLNSKPSLSDNYQTFLAIALTGFAAGVIAAIFMGHRYRGVLHALQKAYNLLHHQEQRRKTIVEKLPVGLEVYDMDGTLIRRNHRVCEIMGEPSDCRNTLLTNPQIPERILQAFAAREQIRTDFTYYPSMPNPDGSRNKKRVECHGVPVQDGKGRNINYIFILTDHTEQYIQNRRIEQSLRIAQEAMRASDIVLWRLNRRTGMFTSYNDPISDYDNNRQISADEYFSYMHPEDIELCREQHAKMLDGNIEEFEIHVRIKTPQDEEWQYCTVSGSVFSRDENGELLEYVGFRRNNTRYLSLLRQNDLILNNTNSGLIYLTPDYIVQWENVSARKNFFYEGAYAKKSICYKTFGRNRPCKHCVMSHALASGHTERKTFEHGNKSVEIFATPVRNSKNEIEGVVLRLDDITQRQRMICELHKAKMQAERSDRLKSAFLANMSHEIRTPLNAIVGFSELLTTVENPEEKNEFIKIIRHNNNLLLQIISDVLSLSKIEAGFLDRYPEKFDLTDLFAELKTMVANRNSNPQITLQCENPYAHCYASLDKNHFTQIMLSYLTNAIKYTPHGTIRFGYECCDGGIRLYVADTGIGISKANQARIYRHFEQLDDFAQGTGVGLTIAKALTEAAGGRVGFESREGEGSVFWSWFPCEISFDPPKGMDSEISSELRSLHQR